MAHTITWLPKREAISSMSSGRRSAALLTLTLSAPAESMRSTSSTLPMPPPTVKGMESVSATRVTMSVKVLRPSCEAVMSRNTSSSAPASE